MEAFEQLIEQIAPNLYAYRDRFFTSFAATFEMFAKAGIIAFVVGLFFGVLLLITRKGGESRRLPDCEHRHQRVPLDSVYHSADFPHPADARGGRLGHRREGRDFAAGVRHGAVLHAPGGSCADGRERGQGGSRAQHGFRVYLHEAVPELIRVTTVTAISLIGLTTMAGAVGAGGIGSFAINYGQNQNHQDIVNVCVVVLLIVVFILQSLGNALARRTTNRGLFRKVHK